jgi:hypothetical protein
MSTQINVNKKIAILDEGVQLTPDVNQIDFTGGGITATSVGNNVTVSVVAAGITVGTTPVISGTDNRVFFQAGGVVEQDANFVWDNTNKRLGVGASPASTVRLDVRAQGALSTDIAFRVRNSTDTITPFAVNGIGHIETRVDNSFHYKTSVIGSLNTLSKGNFGGYENGMIVGHANTMGQSISMFIFGNNNTCSGNGIILGFNNIDARGNIVGFSNAAIGANVLGNSNSGTGNIFGNGCSLSAKSGQGGSSFMIGDQLTVPNVSSINNTIFFGSRTTSGAPYISMHQNNLGIGGVIPNLTNYDLNARGVFYTQNGTAPTTLVADTFGLYSADIVAGNAAPHFRTENGSVIKLYQSPIFSSIKDIVENTGLSGVNEMIYAKEQAIPFGTLSIDFTEPKIYGKSTVANVSNIIDDLTNAKIGVIQKIYHNNAVPPTVPAGWVLLSGAYVISVLNIITAEWCEGTRVEYKIIQG